MNPPSVNLVNTKLTSEIFWNFVTPSPLLHVRATQLREAGSGKQKPVLSKKNLSQGTFGHGSLRSCKFEFAIDYKFSNDYGDKYIDEKKKNVSINNGDNHCKYVKIRIV